MPRYFFHVENGASPPDTDGVELPGLIEAREQAASLAGAVLHECAGQFWDGQPWSVRVTDDKNLTLFTLDLSATSAPATDSY
jgi:hypothetical protein